MWVASDRNSYIFNNKTGVVMMNEINDLQAGVQIIAQETEYDIDDVQQSIIDKLPITSGPLADMLGMSTSGFNKYHAKHLTPLQTIRQGKKKIVVYDLKPAFHYFIDTLKSSKNDGNKAYHNLELVKERYRKHRLENDLKEGLTMPAEDAILLMQRGFSLLRQAATAIAARVAPQIVQMTSEKEVRETIEEEIADVHTVATRLVTDYQESNGIGSRPDSQAETTSSHTDTNTT